MLPHQEWTETSRRLLANWMTRGGIPALDEPRVHLWQSFGETIFSIAWSGSPFVASWVDFIHDAVRETCVRNNAAWRRQSAGFSDACRQFFADPRDRLSLVMVTPTRPPRTVWRAQGRAILYEYADPVPTPIGNIETLGTLRLSELDRRFDLPVDKLVWCERPGVGRDLVRTSGLRHFDGHRMTLHRIFTYSPCIDEVDVTFGRIPGFDGLVVGAGTSARIHAPMIQLMRITRDYALEVIVFETRSDSGELLDVRWGRHTLRSLIHDPGFPVALDETFLRGKRLCR